MMSITKKKIQELFERLKTLKGATTYEEYAEAFRIVCFLSKRKPGKENISWGDSVDKQAYRQTLTGLELFLPGLLGPKSIYQRRCFEMLILVCGHISTDNFQFSTDANGYKPASVEKKALYPKKAAYKINASFLILLDGFAKDIQFFETFFIVRAFTCCLYDYMMKIDF
jgi:hypothetical protein